MAKKPLTYDEAGSNLRLQAVIEAAIDSIILIDARGRIELVNPAAAQLFAYKEEEMLGQNVKMLMGSPHHEAHDGYLNNYLETRKPKIIGIGREVEGRKKTGETFPCRLAVSEINLGDQILFAGVIHDLTDVKAAEEKLRQHNAKLEAHVAERTQDLAFVNDELKKSQNLYRNIAANYPNGFIIVYNQELKIIFADGKELLRLGLSKDELQGSPVDMIMPEADPEQLKQLFHGHGRSFEMHFRGYDYLMRAVALRDKGEEADRVLVVANNVTHEKKAANKVKEALEQERQLNNLKSRFVSMASHEFRTPLSTILSSVSLIDRYKDPKFEEKRDKHIKRVKESVKNLNNILNDFLSLSKLEEGKILVHPETFNLFTFTQELVEEHQSMAKEGQELQFSCDCEKQEVMLDKHLLKNIFHNLISNAIKYAPENSPIWLRMKVKGGEVYIEVEDQGMGIPAEEQEHLFERFFRAHNVTNIQGTGLGLNIVKEYITLMGGEISFESEVEKGTTFRIKLPLIVA